MGGGVSCRFKLNYYFKVNFTLKRLTPHTESIKQTGDSVLVSLLPLPYAVAPCALARARTTIIVCRAFHYALRLFPLLRVKSAIRVCLNCFIYVISMCGRETLAQIPYSVWHTYECDTRHEAQAHAVTCHVLLAICNRPVTRQVQSSSFRCLTFGSFNCIIKYQRHSSPSKKNPPTGYAK